MLDSLGDRMKSQYEVRSQTYLPRRTYAVIRVDGKAFHSLTAGCTRPYDLGLQSVMDMVAKQLCKTIQGAQFAYVQSDEISVLITDFSKTTTDAWFDYNVQKMVSISASIATASFAEYRGLCPSLNIREWKPALFDSRVFVIPDPAEVANYFVWRQKDSEKNSVQMLARSLYSHKELDGKGIPQLHDAIHEKGKNWNDESVRSKRGGFVWYNPDRGYFLENSGHDGRNKNFDLPNAKISR